MEAFATSVFVFVLIQLHALVCVIAFIVGTVANRFSVIDIFIVFLFVVVVVVFIFIVVVHKTIRSTPLYSKTFFTESRRWH